MRTLFMGSDKIALPLLEVLKRRSSALCVVSQPDKPSGRGQKLAPNDISAWAEGEGVKLLRPKKLDDDFIKELKDFLPDIIFVMAYGRLLKTSIIELPRLGTWNLHASLLPQLRGASPIETAIALGDTHTGVCLMKMVLALDAGPVGASLNIPLSPQTTSAALRSLVAQASAQLVDHEWQLLEKGSVQVHPQDESQATYCRPLTKADTLLDPAAPAVELERRIRAFGERLGTGFVFAGEKLKIFSARVSQENSKQPPGAVLESGERLLVAAGQGTLEILELQRAGGKRLSTKEFLRGYPINVGDQFHGGPLRPLVDAKPFPRGF